MGSTIVGKGLFVFTVSGLACGDEAFLSRYGNPESIQIDMGIKGLAQVFDFFRNTRAARLNRKGFLCLRHPDLGYLQWKQGIDFRTAEHYLIVHHNGQRILEWLPSTPWGERWKAPKGALLSNQYHVEGVLANAPYTMY